MKGPSYNYYMTVYAGSDIPAEEYFTLMPKAEIMIKGIITPQPSDVYSDKEKLKAFADAVCAQTEYLYRNGGSEFISSDTLIKEDLGNYSYTKEPLNGGGMRIASFAVMILKNAGLISPVI